VNSYEKLVNNFLSLISDNKNIEIKKLEPEEYEKYKAYDESEEELKKVFGKKFSKIESYYSDNDGDVITYDLYQLNVNDINNKYFIVSRNNDFYIVKTDKDLNFKKATQITNEEFEKPNTNITYESLLS